MKIKDIVTHNNKQWKIIAIVGNYARIRLLNSRAEKNSRNQRFKGGQIIWKLRKSFVKVETNII